MGSLYSFLDPGPERWRSWQHSTTQKPPSPPGLLGGSAGEPDPDRGQDPPLQPVSGTQQEQISRVKEDRAQSSAEVKPHPSSPSAMTMGTGQLVPELIRAKQVSTEQQCKLLQALLARHRGGAGDGVGACGGTPPGELPCPPTKTEEQVQLQQLRARVWPQSPGAQLPWIDEDVDEALDGVLHKDREVGPETLSSMEVERCGSMPQYVTAVKKEASTAIESRQKQKHFTGYP